MKKMQLLKSAAFFAATLLALTACKNDDPVTVPDPPPAPAVALESPSVTLASEKTANPIVLEFAWSPVENADRYEYELKQKGTLITEGAAEGTSVEIAASGTVNVMAGSEYVFSVRAVPADREKYKTSDWGTAEVSTSPSDFKLSVTNVTYRTADMDCWPADADMKYGLSHIALERYRQYPDDATFYEEYEKGFFRVVAQQLGAPWYMVMEAMMATGESSYHTGSLAPETDYLLYAYGIKAMVEEFDIALVTPIVRVPFRTPAWKATIDCRFDITVAEASAQRIAIDVTPQKNDVPYYFGIAPCLVVEQSYNNDMAALTRDILYSLEAVNKVDWTDTDLLYTGAATFTLEKEQIDGLRPGEKYFAFAFGVDTGGLQTTELSQITFVAPQTSSATPGRNASAQAVPVMTDRSFAPQQRIAIDRAFEVTPLAR